MLPLLIPILLLGFQSYGMYSQFKTLSISNIGPLTWYKYIGVQVYAETNKENIDSVILKRAKEIHQLNSWKEIRKKGADDLKNTIIQHPFIVIKYLGLNIFHNSISKSNAIETHSIRGPEKIYHHTQHLFLILSRLHNILFALLIMYLIYFVIRYFRNLEFSFFILISFVLYSLLTGGISFWQGDRFSIVYYPSILILIMYTSRLVRSKKHLQEK